MAINICLFEDEQLPSLHPLTLTRPADDLRTGILTIREKWELDLEPASTARLLRTHLTDLFPAGSLREDMPCLWINARYLPSGPLLAQVRDLSIGSALKKGDTVIAAKMEYETTEAQLEAGEIDFSGLMVVETEQSFLSIDHLWDLLDYNGDQIRVDLGRLPEPLKKNITVSEDAVMEHREQIFIDEGAMIEPGAVIIAEKGPVYIGIGATVEAGSLIRGPAAICEGATIKMGAKIYGGTTVGPVCKVGGEVNGCIFHSYSNKAHDGFAGDSLFGQWCNLGADTNTSNLKNNYSPVRITDWENRQEIDTGRQFLGTIMGDHSKTAINTQLNTGTVCGVSCNIFSADFPPKFIPSFSWVGSNVIQPYQFDKAVETMKTMMARRDVELLKPYEEMMRYIYDREQE